LSSKGVVLIARKLAEIKHVDHHTFVRGTTLSSADIAVISSGNGSKRKDCKQKERT